ncbi:hypothetical protein N5A93_13780 [Roseovarius sp. EGI FJ00037]|uniref:hypothetical protein n=1 Tax=Roseovarius salincola TaxID=2978479 RepID=UPI0022A878B6|nr:hypothetical protein [Roseovarius sp. EGI FJ00037]MCZ0813310.1 hypothetical protein [Roseovarius sp. EGI FJ00037]
MSIGGTKNPFAQVARGFKRLAEMRADEKALRVRQRSMGILNPMRGQNLRRTVNNRKVFEKSLLASILSAFEGGQSDGTNVGFTYHELAADLALDPADQRSERQRSLGRRRDTVEQLLMAAVEDELKARRMIP